ncbi:nuclear transport factor 2 family protein [Mucilaginibacter sp.]|uniref:nuclear transport factor 2 family protein n=1 Tax=Mucilaginibacter sp. TaxID=1882438 RepID=UPI0032630432
MTNEDIIHQVYTAFNNRDIDGVFKFFLPDVEWPNGWEGGYVHGHQEVRDYWTRQWAELNPIVTPETIKPLQDGRLLVEVRQVVKDLEGNMVFDGPVKHVYEFEGGLIKKMVIEA